MKILCIYHSRDLDGWSSARIVQNRHPSAELVGYDYGEETEFDVAGKDVIMCDVSVDPKDMDQINKEANSFLYIDHHKSAIEKLEEYYHGNIPFETVLDTKHAACELTWEKMFPGQDVPRMINLLGIYDSWREDDGDWENEILPYQYGMRKYIKGPEDFSKLSDLTVEDVIQVGKPVLEYIDGFNEEACKKQAFEMDFKGKKAICMITADRGNRIFKSVWDPSKYDIEMVIQFTKDFWTVSIYCPGEKIDCSALAKEMGGGGHKGAAGFQVEDINELLKK